MQLAKIKKKFPDQYREGCNAIEVDVDDLINMVKYLSPQVCIDFDDEQEQVIQDVFPGKECDFAVIDSSELVGIMRYLSPGAS
jgi:hypothetical protein